MGRMGIFITRSQCDGSLFSRRRSTCPHHGMSISHLGRMGIIILLCGGVFSRRKPACLQHGMLSSHMEHMGINILHDMAKTQHDIFQEDQNLPCLPPLHACCIASDVMFKQRAQAHWITLLYGLLADKEGNTTIS